MKKIVIGLIIAILVISCIVGFMFYRGYKKKKNNNLEGVVSQGASYGKRGNISEADRIMFLSKNDEYLVGMMGLPVSNEMKNFSGDEMIRFALNIAVERYSNILEQKTNKDGSFSYSIKKDMVNSIVAEFFGISEVSFDEYENPYYSRSNKVFLFNENIEKTLYYYPVSQESKDDGSIEITADAIFVSDIQDEDVVKKAKYEGKYGEENVDNTIKFVFDSKGKLISYQHVQ